MPTATVLVVIIVPRYLVAKKTATRYFLKEKKIGPTSDSHKPQLLIKENFSTRNPSLCCCKKQSKICRGSPRIVCPPMMNPIDHLQMLVTCNKLSDVLI